MKTISIGMDGMTLENLVQIARDGVHVKLTEGSEKRLRDTRRLIEKWVEEEKTIYGVTTGFGALSDVVISKKDTRRLQENILMSHAAGVGEPLDEEIVRAVMALRIKDLARGHSGIRLETVRASDRASQLGRLPGDAGQRVGGCQRRPGAAGPSGAGSGRSG